MHKSIYDLAFDYIEQYWQGPVDEATKRSILNSFSEILRRGFTVEEIEGRLRKWVALSTNQGSPPLRTIFNTAPVERNLLKPGRFYYHNQLRIMPGAPKVIWDPNEGTVTRIEEEYYLEMRASYTLDNLLAYYQRQMRLEVGNIMTQRHIGALKYLLEKHDVEIILFMIDMAASTRQEVEDAGYIEPIKLPEYHHMALTVLGDKITEERGAGDDRVTPRKRVLSGRGGSEPVMGVHQEHNPERQ